MTLSNPVAAALAGCVAAWWNRVKPNSGDCRVVLPAPTREVARGLHEELLKGGLPSYLVTSAGPDSLPPSEEKRVLRADAVTSVRDGSFVVVVEPGLLSKLQESIQGSGGGIRSLAIPDEWPWTSADAGFDFFDDFLPRWLAESGYPDSDRAAAATILRVAITATEPMKNRATVVFDEILAERFDPLATATQRADAFCIRVGVPSLNAPSITGPGVPDAGISELKYVGDLATAMQGANAREAIKQNAEDALQELPACDRIDLEDFSKELNFVLDRLRITKDRGRGPLSLRRALPAEPDAWRRLNLEVLRRVFVRLPTAAAVALSARWSTVEENAHVLRGGVHCIAVRAPLPALRIRVDRPAELGAELEIKAGRRRIFGEVLNAGQYDSEIEIEWGKIPEGSSALTITATAGDLPRAATKVYLEKPTDASALFIIVATSTRDLAGIKALRRLNPQVDDDGEESIDIDGSKELFAVSASSAPTVALDGREVGREMLADGIQRLLVDERTVAMAGSPPELRVANGDFQIEVALVAEGKPGGPCNLEVALARSLQTAARGTEAATLLSAWRGDADAGGMLGSPDEDHDKRFKVVTMSFEGAKEPWRPVVISPAAATPASVVEQGWIRVAADGSSLVGPGFSSGRPLASATAALIHDYELARASVFSLVEKRHGKRSRNGLPLYAAASLDFDEGDAIEVAAINYLASFVSIQAALGDSNLPYEDRFLLTFLDAVVVTTGALGGWRVSGAALGPWHPLVLAKRLMAGRGLRRLAGFGTDAENRWLRRLGVLLQDVTGVRWFAGLRADSSQAVPFFVDATDDPGWLVAAPATDVVNVPDQQLLGWERSLLGLSVLRGGGAEAKGFSGYLSDFFRAFPSRRSIVVKASTDTPAWEAAAAARAYLSQADGQPTVCGAALRGGVHIVVDGAGGQAEDYPDWEEPVVCVYPHGGAGFLAGHKVDMLLMQAATGVAFPIQSQPEVVQDAPRGNSIASVLQVPLRTLEHTGAGVRDTRLSYNTSLPKTQPGIGGAFTSAAASTQVAAGPFRSVGVRTLAPAQGIDHSTWTVLPGEGADPAVLLDWARDTAASGAPKVLWDYRMAITQSFRTYFVLSEIPRMLVHHIAGSEVFGSASRAGDALLELASIGLALGSEAFKSRVRALGVVGLVGAARVSQDVLSNACMGEEGCCSFLLPIDSFRDLLGGDLDITTDDGQADYRRGDLIGVACRVTGAGAELAFCAVESKYCGGTFSASRAVSALEQAMRSLQRLSHLSIAAREPDALAERLALARLLEFGLRLHPDRRPETIEAILSSVLRGEHRTGTFGKTGCIVVSTEIGLEASGVEVLDSGTWVRLSPNQWPKEKGAGDYLKVAAELRGVLTAPWQDRSGLLSVRPSAADDVVPSDKPESEFPSAGTGVELPSVSDAPVSSSSAQAPVMLAPPDQPEGRSADQPSVRAPGQVDAGNVELLMGVGEDGRPVLWRAGENSNHNFMVTGSSGLGKTQLLKSLLWQARQQGLPAVVLDFKNDFASDREFLDRATLEVQYVGFEGLPYNPLIPCPQLEPRTGRAVFMLSQHVNGIVAAFQRTYGLGEQQAADLRDSIREALDAAGVASAGVVYEIPDQFPDFAVVGEYLRDRNRLAYNRLDPLFDLGVFRDKYRGVAFNSLLGRGYVLDLSGIQAEHIQNTLAALLVYSAHRYLNAIPHAATVNQLLVFDEAHRVLKLDDVSRLVRECRAYGLGVVLSSQYPTDFPADTAANLSAKVLHGNGPDVSRVQAIRSMLGMQPEADKRLNLPMFNAVCLAKPGHVVFAKTIGYPHRILLEALRDGPMRKEDMKQLKGLHGDKFEQVLQHLVAMQLVVLAGNSVALAA